MYHFYSVPSPPKEPFCNEARLVDSGSGYFSNGTFFRVGLAEICVNNSDTPVCGTLTQEEAILLCVDSEGRYGRCMHAQFVCMLDLFACLICLHA